MAFFVFNACETKPKDKSEKSTVQIKEKVKPKEVVSTEKYDLTSVVITDENVVDFLTWYGQRNKENKVIIETKFGDIELKLYDETPLHRANFIYLVKKNYFNTTFFHRVVKDFIVQGGNSDETITQKDRKAIGNYLIPPEFNRSLRHTYGALAAARQWEDNPKKNSEPYEFYFVQDKRGAHHLDGEHTVYGQITKGFDVLEKIGNEPVDAKDYPLLNVYIKMKIIE